MSADFHLSTKITFSVEGLERLLSIAEEQERLLRETAVAWQQRIADRERTEWWKRGEPAPDLRLCAEPPEWWQRGDEPPPPTGCSA